MRKYLGLLLALLLALPLVSGLAEATGTVVVYSPHDANHHGNCREKTILFLQAALHTPIPFPFFRASKSRAPQAPFTVPKLYIL